MKYILKKKKGFTLIEVIVGVALFAIVSMVLLSVMTFSLKLNYINKDSYDSDSYSKAFYEAIKNENCKPQAGPDTGDVKKCYYSTFNDINEVVTYAQNKFSQIKTSTPTLTSFDPTSEIDISAKITDINNANPNKKVGFILWTNWDKTNKVYQLETWTWNISKGESTLINRKTILAPK